MKHLLILAGKRVFKQSLDYLSIQEAMMNADKQIEAADRLKHEATLDVIANETFSAMEKSASAQRLLDQAREIPKYIMNNIDFGPYKH